MAKFCHIFAGGGVCWPLRLLTNQMLETGQFVLDI